MNKFILLALVATAFAQKECATAEELNKGDGKKEYHLRYLLKEGDNKDAFTTDKPETGKYIGFRNIEHLSYSKIIIENEPKNKFTIKKAKTEEPGFEVHSKQGNSDRLLSWNQTTASLTHGYWMYRASSNPGATHTRFIFDDATNALSAKPDTKNDYVLGIDENAATAIYRKEKLTDKTKDYLFCFQEVGTKKPTTEPTDKPTDKSTEKPTDKNQCKGDDLLRLISSYERFQDANCAKGKTIESSKTCEASCISGKKGTHVQYTCENGNWKKPKTAIVCKAFCKVDDTFLTKLKELDAEFKDNKCKKESEIDEDDTCEASCNEDFKGDKVQYVCDKNGNFVAPEEEIACKSSFGQFGVFVALLCFSALH